MVKKFWCSKKFWLIILALIGIGFFIFFFWFFRFEKGGEFGGELEEIQAKVSLSVSAVYRYDFKKQEYLPDRGESWQNSDFTRYIYDLAPPGLELDRCYYFLYDNIKKEMIDGGQRKCNANLTITVGQEGDCSSQGENACTLYVYTVDSSGTRGEMTAVTYHIDWERPKVGKVYQKDKSYLVEVSDNLEVSYCWLYLNGKNVGPMKIKSGFASLAYSLVKEESHTAFVRCADHYAPEKENYLNFAAGELTEIIVFQNHPPQISSCRVTPTQGTTKTDFRFEIIASDPDGDAMIYRWDFNDGEVSNEVNPIHNYKKSGTYEPKVEVSDEKDEKDECSTAWVVVSQE
jgi:hypothetical protein